jgi:OOP family OmpA-OmpF porin
VWLFRIPFGFVFDERSKEGTMMQEQSKNAILKLGVLALAGAVSTAAVGQTETSADKQDSGYVTILPFYLSADANRRGTTEDGRGMVVGYGHPIGQSRWNWELQTFAGLINVQPQAASDFDNYGAGLDFTYRFRPEGVSPFVLLGGGVLRNDVVPDAFSDTDYFANAAFGIVTGGLGKSEIRLRTEVRYVRDAFEIANEGHKNDRRLAIGVEIPLGRHTVEREVVREVPREVTREVPAQIVDSDKDGVPDQNDRCPGTLEGLATDSRGCAATAEQASVRLEGVTFELNSARLTPQAEDTLRRVTDALKGEPNLRAEIAGHTDSSGDAAYNQRLSQERANSVLEFLVSQGIDRSRLVARGYGEERPVASNDTPAGRERNRRVEFNVLN